MRKILNCIIIDDEKKARENLTMLLKLYCPEVSILDEAWDKFSIIKVLNTHSPDIVFLDIQLENTSIFDILNELKAIDFKIIFVTAFDKYAIKGYQYDAIDYLLKPINPKKLIAVIEKAHKLLENDQTKKEALNTNSILQKSASEFSKISVTDAKGVHVIECLDILYCESDGNYTTFKLKNGKEIIISKNLKHFETNLKIYNFIRIHKSYLINLQNIDFIVKENGGLVIMKNGKSLPVSRSRKKELYQKMNLL